MSFVVERGVGVSSVDAFRGYIAGGMDEGVESMVLDRWRLPHWLVPGGWVPREWPLPGWTAAQWADAVLLVGFLVVVCWYVWTRGDESWPRFRWDDWIIGGVLFVVVAVGCLLVDAFQWLVSYPVSLRALVTLRSFSVLLVVVGVGVTVGALGLWTVALWVDA